MSNSKTDAPSAQLEQLDQLQSRIEIEEVLAHYCRGCDNRDEDEFLSIWHPDAQFRLGPTFPGAFEGESGIREALHLIWGALRETRHWTTNLIVTFEGSAAASVYSDVDCHTVNEKGEFLSVAATYHDRLERRDGVWKFSERIVKQHWERMLPNEQRI